MSATGSRGSNDGEGVPLEALYTQGSKSCQQYSQLTMQIRMLSQQIMVGYAAGILVALSKFNTWSAQARPVLFVGGAVLLTFSVVLGILHYHYASAFEAVRDALVELEASRAGGWTAHRELRRPRRLQKYAAWFGPFLAMGTIGVITAAFGLRY